MQNKKNVICNIYSGGINAILSVVWGSIITRRLGVESAGIFTIAYASACLFLTVGYYGMRNFQVSDMKNEYNWKEYHVSRIMTTVAMLLVALIYTCVMYMQGTYDIEKCLIVMGMSLIKGIDSYEDIYHGKYQRDGRLDIAGFFMGTRLLIQLIVMSVLITVSNNLVGSIYITFILGCILLMLFNSFGNLKVHFSKDNLRLDYLKKLLITCWPICISSFLAFFLNNMSKYVIDLKLDNIVQAYYGYISMPIFGVYLLANFIYTPMINKMSMSWCNKEIRTFKRFVWEAVGLISIVAVLVIFLGNFVGLFLLEKIYKLSLIQYKTEFMILLLGSVLYAYVVYLTVIITIIRQQKKCLYVTGIGIIFSFVITNRLVGSDGLWGASMSYLLSMTITLFLYIIVLIKEIVEEGKSENIQ